MAIGVDVAVRTENSGMPKVRYAAAVVAGLVLAGCATSGGDMIVRVSGSVPPGQGDVRALDCELSMLGEVEGVVSSKPVGSTFSVPMMVVAGPEPRSYQFAVECRDGRRFASKEVQISSRRSYARDLNLGELQER